MRFFEVLATGKLEGKRGKEREREGRGGLSVSRKSPWRRGCDLYNLAKWWATQSYTGSLVIPHLLRQERSSSFSHLNHPLPSLFCICLIESSAWRCFFEKMRCRFPVCRLKYLTGMINTPICNAVIIYCVKNNKSLLHFPHASLNFSFHVRETQSNVI